MYQQQLHLNDATPESYQGKKYASCHRHNILDCTGDMQEHICFVRAVWQMRRHSLCFGVVLLLCIVYLIVVFPFWCVHLGLLQLLRLQIMLSSSVVKMN